MGIPARAAILLSLCLGSTVSFAQQGTEVVSLTIGSELRSYRLHVPATLPAGKVPLVVSIHGFNSNAAQQESISAFSTLADSQGFVVAYPDGLQSEWRVFGRTDADITFISTMISAISTKYPIDPDRVMVNGISNGAQMSWALACNKPGLFAVVGLVSGGYPNACTTAKHPRTIVFHGTADALLPYEGRAGLMPVPEFVAQWAACDKQAVGAPVDTSGEATSVRFSCTGGNETLFYTIAGKGHSWPGSTMPADITTSEVKASQAMLEFMAQVTSASEVETANKLFEVAETRYRQLFPSRAATQSQGSWLYRFYPATGIYVGVSTSAVDKGGVYVMGGSFGGTPQRVGSVGDFLR